MINELEKYPSLLLDDEEYAMIPMKSGISLEEEIEKNYTRDSNETYLYDENDYRGERSEIKYEFDEFDEFNELEDLSYMDEDLKRDNRTFKPVFGVPLFIEERYMDDEEENEDLLRGHKHHCHCNCDVNRIYMKIRKCNPEIFDALRRYCIPAEQCKRIIMRIIKLTLKYSNR